MSAPIPQPRFWYLHRCARCGVPIRRWRLNSIAAWQRRNGLTPRPWPITWVDSSGSQSCDGPHARRWRREHGRHPVDQHLGPDAEHRPVRWTDDVI